MPGAVGRRGVAFRRKLVDRRRQFAPQLAASRKSPGLRQGPAPSSPGSYSPPQSSRLQELRGPRFFSRAEALEASLRAGLTSNGLHLEVHAVKNALSKLFRAAGTGVALVGATGLIFGAY